MYNMNIWQPPWHVIILKKSIPMAFRTVSKKLILQLSHKFVRLLFDEDLY